MGKTDNIKNIEFSEAPNLKDKTNDDVLLFPAFFEIAQELCLILDEKGYIRAANKSGANHLEYTEDELIGMHLTNLVDVSQLKEFSKKFDEVLIKGEGNIKVSLQSKLGFSQLFNLNCKALYGEDSKIRSLLITGVNVDEIKKYEKEILDLYPKLLELQRIVQIENQRANPSKFILKELHRIRATFISNISHELRTPLASIIGFAETIASDSSLSPEVINEFNNIILSEGKRLARLVNNILDLSMIQQGKFMLNKTKFNLVKDIKELLKEFSNSATEKNLAINFESNKEEIEIEADESRIMRTIASVIHNAVKFTENSGRVYIQVKEVFKEVDIVVIDTGIGIHPNEIPNIFKKLADEKINFSESYISGFSLSYAKQIIELHRGLIDIQSELNKGTTVFIKLPKQNF